MSARTPIFLFALLVAAVVAIAAQGDPAGLLMLTPVLAVLLPLLASAYPGEKSIARVASWLFGMRRPDAGRSISHFLDAVTPHVLLDAFAAANGSRGPPSLSRN